MWQFQLGDVTVSRAGEMPAPGFDPAFLGATTARGNHINRHPVMGNGQCITLGV